MISIHRILLGFLLGSSILIFIALQLFTPQENVQASNISAVEENQNFGIVLETLKEDCLLPRAYPDSIHQWCQLITASAAKYSVDPKLIAAVILQESGGDHEAYSSSGAVGLMQVMPRDGIASNFVCINGPCFANRPTMQELFDPEFNVDFGSRMLLNLYEKHGNWRDALHAYGPMDMGYKYADIVLNIYHNYQ